MREESAHSFLAFGQFHLAVFIPEVIATHLCVSLFHLFCLAFEELFRQVVEGIVGQSRGSYHGGTREPFVESEFGNHIIYAEGP